MEVKQYNSINSDDDLITKYYQIKKAYNKLVIEYDNIKLHIKLGKIKLKKDEGFSGFKTKKEQEEAIQLYMADLENALISTKEKMLQAELDTEMAVFKLQMEFPEQLKTNTL